MFFGNYLNGLFSAQVVPNNEEVSLNYGKKIFAFPQMVLDDTKQAPKLKLDEKVFPKEFLKAYDEMLNDSETFYKIYDVETIGHEFGHILWIDRDTEIKMNAKTGNFKNIEEFKATSGGFITYIETYGLKDTDFLKKMLILHIKRVINLLKYYNTVEIWPYYYEALIHLDLLYSAGLVSFDKTKIMIDFSKKILNKFIETYKKTYKKLAKLYLEKKIQVNLCLIMLNLRIELVIL